jgi:hypothetical protein
MLPKSASTGSFSPPLSVLDVVDDEFVIWHVNIGPEHGLSRLTGAWVIRRDRAETIRHLVAGLPAVHCTETLVLPQGVASLSVIDVTATVERVRTEISAADQRFTEHDATVKHPLVRPEWPSIHHPAAARALSPAPDGRLRAALDLAHGIAELAQAWADFEALRVAREYLIPLGGPAARPLPLEEIA